MTPRPYRIPLVLLLALLVALGAAAQGGNETQDGPNDGSGSTPSNGDGGGDGSDGNQTGGGSDGSDGGSDGSSGDGNGTQDGSDNEPTDPGPGDGNETQDGGSSGNGTGNEGGGSGDGSDSGSGNETGGDGGDTGNGGTGNGTTAGEDTGQDAGDTDDGQMPPLQGQRQRDRDDDDDDDDDDDKDDKKNKESKRPRDTPVSDPIDKGTSVGDVIERLISDDGCQGPKRLTTRSDGVKNTLEWSPVDGAESYRIYRAGLGNEHTLLNTTAGDTTVYIDQEVELGATYAYRVTAVIDGTETEACTYTNITTMSLLPTLLSLGIAAGVATTAYVVFRRRA